MAFTAISPYMYVFRSEKVRKCVADLWNGQTGGRHFHLSQTSDRRSIADTVSTPNHFASGKKITKKERLSRRATISTFNYISEESLNNSTPTLCNNTPRNVKDDKRLASQDDLPYNQSQPSQIHQSHNADERISNSTATAQSCPDILKMSKSLRDVCLESSL